MHHLPGSCIADWVSHLPTGQTPLGAQRGSWPHTGRHWGSRATTREDLSPAGSCSSCLGVGSARCESSGNLAPDETLSTAPRETLTEAPGKLPLDSQLTHPVRSCVCCSKLLSLAVICSTAMTTTDTERARNRPEVTQHVGRVPGSTPSLPPTASAT